MSWVSANLANLCPPNSSCQPPTFMFLTLVASLFGHPEVSYPNKNIGKYGRNNPILIQTNTDKIKTKMLSQKPINHTLNSYNKEMKYGKCYHYVQFQKLISREESLGLLDHGHQWILHLPISTYKI
ncbi:hypothetical protein E2986_13929 [Frieseomelitta varia]|uniref:Uncharacterized protein n=1 Tax=Frieseomelitta varia TaxID=561572 RepID=A0A833SLM9_9HYME|nr:hypothetical protein E2986_13929 [Frieseomelitta varia]